MAATLLRPRKSLQRVGENEEKLRFSIWVESFLKRDNSLPQILLVYLFLLYATGFLPPNLSTTENKNIKGRPVNFAWKKFGRIKI